MEELVSICIPTFNNESYIRATLLSVLRQTYRNIEIIVVDDCSGDGTIEIIEAFKQKDDRIRLVKNDENLGMVGNWNKCLSLAAGEFIKLICGDDMLDKTAVAKEVAAMRKHSTVNLVESDTRLVDSYGKKTGVFRRYPASGLVNGQKVAKVSLIMQNFFGSPVNNLIRRSALQQTGGFDSSFTYILDFDLWIRLACCGEVYIIHEVLNSFRVRNDSNTGILIRNKRKVYLDEHKQLLKKHAEAGMIKISSSEIKLSVLIRKFRNVLIDVYLRIFAS